MELVTLKGRDGLSFDIFGEPTAVKGLLITPKVDFRPDRPTRYCHGWALTHTTSGRCFPVGFDDPDEAREIAHRFAKVCDDWTTLDEDPKNWPAHIREGIVAATQQFHREQIELASMT